MIRALIDTNVVLDCLARRQPFVHDADGIFDLIEKGSVLGFVTASSVTDIHYLLGKAIGINLSLRAMEYLFEAFEVLSVTKADCVNALRSTIKDYEDALIAECANNAELDFIVTRDMEFLNYPKAISPTDFLKKISL